MKILHLPSTFFPDHTGGKEVFVLNLIKYSPEAEHVVVIHDAVTSPTQYQYDGVSVIVLPLPVTSRWRHAYYSLEYDSLPGFNEVLDSFAPDLVHFHDQGSHASLTHLWECKKRAIKTLLTYHSPGQSCLQRALLFTGQTPCDGRIDLTRCTYCRYRIRGIPTTLAAVGSRVSLPFDRSGRVILRNSTRLFARRSEQFFKQIDGIQIHADWIRDLLLLNKVQEEKIHFIEIGGPASLPPAQWGNKVAKVPLRLVFVGRCSDSKGIHILIDAIQSLPRTVPVKVYFFGPSWDDTAYGQELIKKVGGDDRFTRPQLFKPSSVVMELVGMDVCIIPSLWPETGPFTIFDAFAAGLPVIGTNHAGIAERVRDNVDGLLFEWGSSADLAGKIMRLVNNPSNISAMKSNILQNRTFETMAADFLQLYGSLLKREVREK